MNANILTVLGMALILTTQASSEAIAAVESKSNSATAAVADVGAGRVAWFDITSTNLPQSKEFYGKLFDWIFTPVAGTDQAVEIKKGDQSIGTLRVAEGKISTFNGVIYVQVDDILASCKKAKDLGASISEGFPFNLPDGRGAIAVAIDQSGHPVGMFSRVPAPTPAATPAAK